ncbi:hypothetical protein C8046_00640 [Serinibacter arcticus]|uniref:Uncharacterized protein n=1 Tax=Serinibacter arcticus TaxID=1655435 RepID=A0A2U1ZR15_9MICO|nr:hypothetical protein C8046_00640 [Serinibacter arcticus]
MAPPLTRTGVDRASPPPSPTPAARIAQPAEQTYYVVNATNDASVNLHRRPPSSRGHGRTRWRVTRGGSSGVVGEEGEQVQGDESSDTS